jgi:hypothetical protein
MINFFNETIQAIGKSRNCLPNVIFIGSEDREFYCSWTSFEQLADFEYDNQSGDMVIPEDLIVEFNNKKKLVRRYDQDGEHWKLVNSEPLDDYLIIRKLHALGCRTLKEVDEAIDKEKLEL